MSDEAVVTAGIGKHGATRLPSADVDSYNIELKDEDGFLGDRASKGAFHDILEELRKPLRKQGEDPLGDKSSDEMSMPASFFTAPSRVGSSSTWRQILDFHTCALERSSAFFWRVSTTPQRMLVPPI